MTALRHAEPLRPFEPNAGNQRSLRDAFGRFVTGVTIVTVATDEGPVAITANSFSSVSLDPPLVLWSPDKSSRRFRFFAQAEHFAIHILASDQDDLCWRVARDMRGIGPDDIAWNDEGVPVLTHSLARFDCKRHAVHDGGDHDIVVGRVLRAGFREDGDALGFFKGKMNRFTA
jgi:flavin reductase (DIM6/NTAB) family NADH-FMN oxidoreductase RutF